LASPVSWSHHFIWMILLVAWLALAEDRPRAGEWWALGVAVLLWAAPYWWVPHGPAVRFAGRGWLLPVGNAYVLVFIVLLVGAAVRVVRSHQARPLRLGRRTMAPSGAGS
jgi:alpha-1,2-mannosyltransferase